MPFDISKYTEKFEIWLGLLTVPVLCEVES